MMLARATAIARANVVVDTVDARTGRILKRTRRHNLVVDAGLNLLRDVVHGGTATISHGAVGTGNVAPAAGDVGLGAEVFRDILTTKTKAEGALELKFVVGSQSANGNTLREAGLFNSASGPTMYARVIPEAIAKTSSILVIYTWTLSWGAVA